jgi:hypothetical protein
VWPHCVALILAHSKKCYPSSFFHPIIQHDIDPLHRVVLTIFDFESHVLGMPNIYVSNDADERMTLWEQLAKALCEACWLFYGDFDNVET